MFLGSPIGGSCDRCACLYIEVEEKLGPKSRVIREMSFAERYEASDVEKRERAKMAWMAVDVDARAWAYTDLEGDGAAGVGGAIV